MVNIIKQKGIALIISLVFLIALTTIASSLMNNTTIDIKISGANQEKVLATQEALSAINEVIAKQVEEVDGENYFTGNEAAYPYNIKVSSSNTQAKILLATNNSHHVNCSHSTAPSSIHVIRCNYFVIEVNKLYGRNNYQRITMKARIAQQVLSKEN